MPHGPHAHAGHAIHQDGTFSGAPPGKELELAAVEHHEGEAPQPAQSLRAMLAALTPDFVIQFLEMPFLISSPLPHSLDYGFTRFRHTLWLLLNDIDSQASYFTFLVIMATIILSIITFCVQSMPVYRQRAELELMGAEEDAFRLIETICVSIFSADYFGRLLTVTSVPNAYESARIARLGPAGGVLEYPKDLKGWWALLKGNAKKVVLFMLSPLNVVDLAAIAPFYIALAGVSMQNGTAIVRVVRLARVIRLLRLTKGMEGISVLSATMANSAEALSFLTFFLLLAVILFGSIVFFCEEGVYDADTGLWMRPTIDGTGTESSPFLSIPHSLWYTLVTMTTVGYGDLVPTSPAGKVVGAASIMIGILVLALPITVVGGAFTDELKSAAERKRALKLERAQSAANKAAMIAQGVGSESLRPVASTAASTASSPTVALRVPAALVSPIVRSFDASGGSVDAFVPLRISTGGGGDAGAWRAGIERQMAALVELATAQREAVAALREHARTAGSSGGGEADSPQLRSMAAPGGAETPLTH
jgi:hypothetical protein